MVDTLFISRQGHFSCPCRTGAVMLGSISRAVSPTASTSQLTRSLEARCTLDVGPALMHIQIVHLHPDVTTLLLCTGSVLQMFNPTASIAGIRMG